MALPSLVELLPPTPPPRDVAVTVPGSKSATNRLLILAALATGTTRLNGALWSEDTQVMVECLKQLGFEVSCANDPAEPANRMITVRGGCGAVPVGGSGERPLELFVGNAGTAARFLTALLCLGSGVYRLHGVPRMHERPQAALFDALRALGYRIDSPNGRLPAIVHGGGAKAGECRVSILESSQFASALLLCAKPGGWTVTVLGENAEESPYVRLTEHLVSSFPVGGGTVEVEADASSASYFLAADHLLRGSPDPWLSEATTQPGSIVGVKNWPKTDSQIDARFSLYALSAGKGKSKIRPAREISRSRDLADSIMTAIVLAPFWAAPTRFTDLGRLRVQECERVMALRTELTRCGAQVEEQGDTLTVYPSTLHGARIETYGDHRMAMCFAVLGLRIPQVQICDPACVRKTFPNFFQKLAALPPHGPGAGIVDACTGQPLRKEDLE